MHPDLCVITCQTNDVITQIPETLLCMLFTSLFRHFTPLQIGMFVESVHEAEFFKANLYFQLAICYNLRLCSLTIKKCFAWSEMYKWQNILDCYIHYKNTKMNFNISVSCKQGWESKFFFALLLFWLKWFKDIDFVHMILDDWVCVCV